MAEELANSTSNPGSIPTTGEALDWDALAKKLRIGSAEEAKKRAYEIADFVARVEDDKDSELILKTGGKKLALTLNR
jgi:hypothetical protein